MIIIHNKNIVKNFNQSLILHLLVHLLHKAEVEAEIKKYKKFNKMKTWNTKIVEETYKIIMKEYQKINKNHYKDKGYILLIMIDKENIQDLM